MEGCGKRPFLQQHDGFVFDTAKSLHPARIQILYESALIAAPERFCQRPAWRSRMRRPLCRLSTRRGSAVPGV